MVKRNSLFLQNRAAKLKPLNMAMPTLKSNEITQREENLSTPDINAKLQKINFLLDIGHADNGEQAKKLKNL